LAFLHAEVRQERAGGGQGVAHPLEKRDSLGRIEVAHHALRDDDGALRAVELLRQHVREAGRKDVHVQHPQPIPEACSQGRRHPRDQQLALVGDHRR
jgi:hypothetical protein